MTPRKPSQHRRKPPRGQAERGRMGGAASGRLWLYGRHAVAAALGNAKRRTFRLVATQNALRDLGSLPAGLAVETTRTPHDLESLLPPGAVHQGLALEVAPLEPAPLEVFLHNLGDGPAVIVLLDQVTDPHNVGAILRSAAAFSAAAVVTTDRQAAPESGALAKAASGALDIVPYLSVVNLSRALEQLAEAGFWRIGLEGETDATLEEALGSERVALVMGAEGPGLRRLTREHCDQLARLPISGAMESLNVSNAAAIALYLAARGKD